MERGLLWLPLLAVFFWLAWAGWNEYQKLEAYKRWAQPFQNAKYDIYAALGVSDEAITWGLPTRQGPVDLKTIPLRDIKTITLMVDNQPVTPGILPDRGASIVLLVDYADQQTAQIPFTEVALADQWRRYLLCKGDNDNLPA